MQALSILTSTKEERLSFVKEEFKCIGNCRLCGNCAFLRGKEAEDLYKDYIDGIREFIEITKEHRDSHL